MICLPGTGGYAAVTKLSELGIIKGSPEGRYRPEDPVTRAEVAAMIYREHQAMEDELSRVKSEENLIMTAVANALPSVVVVESSGGEGAGFFVDATHVLTAAHVVEYDNRVRITLLGGTRYIGTVVKTSDLDLALIEVHPKETVKPLTFASTYTVGETAVAIGHPQGLEFSVTRGILSNKDRVMDGDPQRYIQFDTQINAGNSGGPLINADGQVIGLVDAKLIGNGVEGIGLAVRVDEIQPFLAK